MGLVLSFASGSVLEKRHWEADQKDFKEGCCNSL